MRTEPVRVFDEFRSTGGAELRFDAFNDRSARRRHAWRLDGWASDFLARLLVRPEARVDSRFNGVELLGRRMPVEAFADRRLERTAWFLLLCPIVDLLLDRLLDVLVASVFLDQLVPLLLVLEDAILLLAELDVVVSDPRVEPPLAGRALHLLHQFAPLLCACLGHLLHDVFARGRLLRLPYLRELVSR